MPNERSERANVKRENETSKCQTRDRDVTSGSNGWIVTGRNGGKRTDQTDGTRTTGMDGGERIDVVVLFKFFMLTD